jgi:HAD superfamily phosphoserine phosphatase-like hydrolase
MTRMRVLLDFDGTVTQADTVDLLLERFALPQWRDVESEWEAGVIGSRECLERQSSLLRATPEQLDALIDHVPIDPGIHGLVRRCHAHALELLIVSDGYDRVIRRALGRAGLSIPFVSNVLLPKGRNEWRLVAPSAMADCRVGAAHCKCARTDTTAPIVLIGDGRSDFCVAHAATFVLAKGKLARYCAERHLPHVAIHDLEGAIAALEQWLFTFEPASAESLEIGEPA